MIEIVYIIAYVLDLKDLSELGIRDLAIASSKVLIQLSRVLELRVFLYNLPIFLTKVFRYRNQVIKVISIILLDTANLYCPVDCWQITRSILVRTELLGITVLVNDAYYRKVGYRGADNLKLSKV